MTTATLHLSVGLNLKELAQKTLVNVSRTFQSNGVYRSTLLSISFFEPTDDQRGLGNHDGKTMERISSKGIRDILSFSKSCE